MLTFSVEDHAIGDTLSLTMPGELRVRGSAAGRNDFRGLELIHNGEVIQTTDSTPAEGYFTAEIDFSLKIDSPGWLALRIPDDAGKNEFEHYQFAHTSPVYIEMAGRRIFRAEVAQALIEEIEKNIDIINLQGTFENNEEWQAVISVHRQGIDNLRRRISESILTRPK